MAKAPRFAVQIGAVDRLGASDSEMYQEAILDARYAQELGFDAVWIVEHHFSDYYPTPNPLMFLSHLAAAVPGMGLGTAGVGVPRDDPGRFSRDAAMVAPPAKGPLYIGMGRGTAKLEYDALRIDMNEARDRFQECWEVTQLALKGEPFTYSGRFVKLDRPITVRPRIEQSREIGFFGAIGSPGSGEIMADLGLAPLSLSQFPDYMLAKILERWRRRMSEKGFATDVTLPVSTKCFIGDTDTAAREEARGHMARFYKLQAEHYTTDTTPWGDIKGYEQFAKIFANMRLMGDPAQNDPILERNLIGAPETVARRINELRALGFNYVLLSNAMHGVEREVRLRMMRRFAKEVIPLVNSLPVPETPTFERVRAAE